MEERAKTISLHYYDDEILYKDELGLHLKEGVKRLSYPDTNEESYINEIDLKVQKRRIKEKELYTREDGITEY